MSSSAEDLPPYSSPLDNSVTLGEQIGSAVAAFRNSLPADINDAIRDEMCADFARHTYVAGQLALIQAAAVVYGQVSEGGRLLAAAVDQAMKR